MITGRDEELDVVVSTGGGGCCGRLHQRPVFCTRLAGGIWCSVIGVRCSVFGLASRGRESAGVRVCVCCSRSDIGGIPAAHPGTSVPGSPVCDCAAWAFQPEHLPFASDVPACRRAADGSPRVRAPEAPCVGCLFL